MAKPGMVGVVGTAGMAWMALVAMLLAETAAETAPVVTAPETGFADFE